MSPETRPANRRKRDRRMIVEFFNPAIARNPVNWFTVLFMLLIFTMFADLLLRHYGDLNWLANPQYQGS